MSDADGLAGEAECDLGWAIAMLARDYRAHVEPVFVDVPRGARGYQLLYTVARKRIRTQVQLADYLGVDRSVIPYVVDDLVDAGLVVRTPDPTDRRVRTVVVTEQGVAELAKVQAALDDAERRFLGPLSAAQQHLLRSLLGDVARRARGALDVDG